MKKVVAIILSLMLLLGLCSVAQAAVTIPTTADKTQAAALGVTVEAPAVTVEQVGNKYVITLSKNLDDFDSWGGNADFTNPETGSGPSIEPEILGNNQLGIEIPDGTEGYEFTFHFYQSSGEEGINVNIMNQYNVAGENTFNQYNKYTYGDAGSSYLNVEFSPEGKILYESSSDGYTVYFNKAGDLTSYGIHTELDNSATLNLEYTKYGKLIWANYYDDDNDYYLENNQWYSCDGEPVAAPVDLSGYTAPYVAPFQINAPAAKVENVDLSKIDLEVLEDGTYYYYDGDVNAWYDEDGNLSRYFYFNLEGNEEYQYHFAPNGNLVNQQVYTENKDGNFYLTSETQYYANSGAPRSYYYVAETGEDVYCLADGTVESIHFYDEETGISYGWDSWDGWYAWNDMGEDIAVDASAMPDPQSFKGPALVTVTAVTKDDVQVVPNAASIAPTLPVALADLPTITSATVDGNKVTISVSDELDEMNFYNDDDYLAVSLDVQYMLDDEYYWASTSYNDVVVFSLESEPVFYYNPETKTYELNLPEGAEVTDYELYIYRQIDNMSYYYSITEDGVNVSVHNDYLNDVSQTFYYEEGKLVRVNTSVDDYYLTSYYDEEGKLESYRFPVAENNHATFLPDGTLDFIRYYDSENNESIYWDATNGWHTREYAEDDTFVPTAVEKPADAVDPEDVKPIIVISKKPEPVWFPKNTLGLAAVSMKDLGISSDWHNVAPVDLTKDGTTVFTLVGADAWILGQAYVTVADGNVTVDYALLKGHGYMKSEKMNWFLTKADLTEENLKAESNYAFGEPVSIADQLGGAEMAILFIDSKVTFRQPYFDAYNYSTRYYRNRENWKEYREGLIEMIGE